MKKVKSILLVLIVAITMGTSILNYQNSKERSNFTMVNLEAVAFAYNANELRPTGIIRNYEKVDYLSPTTFSSSSTLNLGNSYGVSVQNGTSYTRIACCSYTGQQNDICDLSYTTYATNSAWQPCNDPYKVKM